MRRVLSTEDFGLCFARFLPGAAAQQPATLFTPVVVTDRADGKIAHLDGLNLKSRLVLALDHQAASR